MAKYLLIYHGGVKPNDNDMGKMMAAWQKWVISMGSSLIDPGNGVGMSKTVFSDGTVVDNGGSNPVSGYTLLRADSMEDALSALNDHPFLATGGNIEIAETKMY